MILVQLKENNANYNIFEWLRCDGFRKDQKIPHGLGGMCYGVIHSAC